MPSMWEGQAYHLHMYGHTYIPTCVHVRLLCTAGDTWITAVSHFQCVVCLINGYSSRAACTGSHHYVASKFRSVQSLVSPLSLAPLLCPPPKEAQSRSYPVPPPSLLLHSLTPRSVCLSVLYHKPAPPSPLSFVPVVAVRAELALYTHLPSSTELQG